MALFSGLTHYTYTGTEHIPCYQPGASEDGYLLPSDISTSAVPYDTVAGVSYTFVPGDAFRVKLFTSNSSVAVTIPSGLTVGAVYQGYALGAGRVTIGFQAGVNVRFPRDATNLNCAITRAQNSPFSFGMIATNDALVDGDLVSS